MRPANGWTLLELIIVLAIIGAISSLALPGLRDSLPSLRLTSQAREIVVLLRGARRRAIETGQETVVFVDLNRRTLSAADARPLALDPRYRVDILSAVFAGDTAGSTQIRFFPDGTATGAQLRLSDGARHADIVVDWMLGKAALRDE